MARREQNKAGGNEIVTLGLSVVNLGKNARKDA
jgi:hypothetical protein